jgi:hypothetical protein
VIPLVHLCHHFFVARTCASAKPHWEGLLLAILTLNSLSLHHQGFLCKMGALVNVLDLSNDVPKVFPCNVIGVHEVDRSQ